MNKNLLYLILVITYSVLQEAVTLRSKEHKDAAKLPNRDLDKNRDLLEPLKVTCDKSLNNCPSTSRHRINPLHTKNTSNVFDNLNDMIENNVLQRLIIDGLDRIVSTHEKVLGNNFENKRFQRVVKNRRSKSRIQNGKSKSVSSTKKAFRNTNNSSLNDLSTTEVKKNDTNNSTGLTNVTNKAAASPLKSGDMKDMESDFYMNLFNSDGVTQSSNKVDTKEYNKNNGSKHDLSKMYRVHTDDFLKRINALQQLNGIKNITNTDIINANPDKITSNDNLNVVNKEAKSNKPLDKTIAIVPSNIQTVSNLVEIKNPLQILPFENISKPVQSLYDLIKVNQPQFINNLKKIDMSLLSFPPAFYYGSSVIKAKSLANMCSINKTNNSSSIDSNIISNLISNRVTNNSRVAPKSTASPPIGTNLSSVLFQPNQNIGLQQNNHVPSDEGNVNVRSEVNNVRGTNNQLNTHNNFSSITSNDKDLMADLFTERQTVSSSKKDANDLHRVPLSRNLNNPSNTSEYEGNNQLMDKSTDKEASSSENENDNNVLNFDDVKNDEGKLFQ